MLGMVIGLAVAGSLGRGTLTTADGKPWYSPSAAVAFAVPGVLLIIFSAILYRRWAGSLVAGTTLVMLLLQIVFMWGYSLSPDARSEGRILAQRILAVYPHARIYSYHPLGKDPPLEMPIYLNRAITRVDSPSGITPAGQEPQVILVAVRQTLPVPPPNP